MKDPAAVSLGKRGGEARAKKLKRKVRVEIGQRAIAARWARYRKEKGLPAKPGDEKFL